MKNRNIILVIVVVLFFGFVSSLFLNISDLYSVCTKLGCICPQERTEIPCNTCTKNTYYYNIFIFSAGKQCFAQEIITCENGEETNTKLTVYENCKMFISFMGNRI